MAIRRLATASAITGSKSSKIWNQDTFPTGMFALSTITLTTAASTASFLDVPSGFTALQIRAITRCTASAGGSDILIRFNNDSSSNYSYHLMQSNGSSAANTGGTSQTYIRNQGTADEGQGSTTWDTHILDIPDYTSTSKAKTLKGLVGGDYNGNGYIRLLSGNWFKNSSSVYEAITQVDLIASGTTFVAGSTFALYGIKAAS